RFKRRLEKSRAYEEDKYFGNPSQFVHKLKFSSAELGFNGLVEKEPGEPNYSDNLKGNIIYNKNNRYRLILGNFKLNSYTGMLQKEGFSFDQYIFRYSKNFADFTKTSLSTIDFFGYNGISGYYQTGNNRLNVFYGRKYISATLDDYDRIKTVNLYAYARTENEMGRYLNSYHEVKGAAIEGRISDLSYGLSLSQENFDRQISSDSNLSEAVLSEIFISAVRGKWRLRFDGATNFDKTDIKLNAVVRTKDLTTDIIYGYIQKDRFSLTSPGMMFGNGEREQAFGLKFKAAPFKRTVFISENIIYSSKQSGTDLTGAVFSFKTNIRINNTVFEPSFRYKSKESADDVFMFEENTQYQTRLKIVHDAGPLSFSSDIKYVDDQTKAFGYIFGYALYYRDDFFRLKIGGDIYYSKNGTMLYSSYVDTGKYPGLYSFSGSGRKVYLMTGYSDKRYEILAGISRHKTEDGETFGSGYDTIYSDTVHTVEVNFSFTF
ncbi:MAG: hypothetical protein R6V47_04485, partial [Candidatus Delongbacteria bacterium]